MANLLAICLIVAIPVSAYAAVVVVLIRHWNSDPLAILTPTCTFDLSPPYHPEGVSSNV